MLGRAQLPAPIADGTLRRRDPYDAAPCSVHLLGIQRMSPAHSARSPEGASLLPALKLTGRRQGLASDKFAMGRGRAQRERRHGRIKKSAESHTQRAFQRDAAHGHGHGHAYLRMLRAQGRPANARGGVRLRLAARCGVGARVSSAPSRRLGARNEIRRSRAVSAPRRRGTPLGHRAPSPPCASRLSRRTHEERARSDARAAEVPLALASAGCARSLPTPMLCGYSPPQAGTVSGRLNTAEAPLRGKFAYPRLRLLVLPC
ncbi:hypothetical protein FB451DRAFT_1553553 [Mycena latifolia]|nr:hypothetical protein FB451DRAFT_1553553 [Mycena latifolia]